MNKCRCCSKNLTSQLFSAKILNKDTAYFDCENCGYVQTEEPTWLEEAYTNSINDSDTGIMLRNLSNVPLLIFSLIADINS